MGTATPRLKLSDVLLLLLFAVVAPVVVAVVVAAVAAVADWSRRNQARHTGPGCFSATGPKLSGVKPHIGPIGARALSPGPTA